MTPFLNIQVKQSFSKAANSYNAAADHQNKVAKNLVHFYNQYQLKEKKVHTSPTTILDMGCGTGFISQHLSAEGLAKRIINIDMSELMLANNKSKPLVCADFQKIPIKKETVDVIFSSYAFQWVDNISSLLQEQYSALKKDGVLFFSVPGINTFQELKAAWNAVDTHAHVHNFYGENEWCANIKVQGFELIHQSKDENILSFDGHKQALQHIKNIGAHNLDTKRSTGLMGKQRYQAFSEAFKKYSRVENKYTLSYQTYYFGLRKS